MIAINGMGKGRGKWRGNKRGLLKGDERSGNEGWKEEDDSGKRKQEVGGEKKESGVKVMNRNISWGKEKERAINVYEVMIKEKKRIKEGRTWPEIEGIAFSSIRVLYKVCYKLKLIIIFFFPGLCKV